MKHHIRMTWTEDRQAGFGAYGWYCDCGAEALAMYLTQTEADAASRRHEADFEGADPDYVDLSGLPDDDADEAWDRADAAIADASARGEL